MESVRIYKLKDGSIEVLNRLKKLGYLIIEGTDIYFKIVRQDMESGFVQCLLHEVYMKKEIMKELYRSGKKFYKHIRLKCDRYGNVKDNDGLKSVLTCWRIEINPLKNYWLGFAPFDIHVGDILYGAGILGECCEEEIKVLKDEEE